MKARKNGKTSLTILVALFFSLHSFGQDNKFALRLEYVPHFSKITDEYVSAQYKLSYQAWLGIDYRITERIHPTIAIGFLNTGEKVKRSYDGALGIEQGDFRYNYNYLAIPVGLRWNAGSFYLHPEIGLAVGISQQVHWRAVYSDGTKETVTYDDSPNSGEFNKLTFPLFMTVGNEFNLGKLSLLVGIKGTFGVNQIVADVPRKNHFYSLGLLLGVKL